MSQIWFYTIISVLIISLISLVGIFTLSINTKVLKKILLILVSFAAGSLLGDVFIHLIPEMVKNGGFSLLASLFLLLGIMVFFVLEKILHWRHCHVPTSENHPHPVGLMNLVGDGLHNFIDGMIIAGAYIVNPALGVATTLAVVLHEIPQEIGDFGILIHAGYSRYKALWFNFISALTSFVGAITILIVGINIESITNFLIPFTAGGFTYIAMSDLIPQLHKQTGFGKTVLQLIFFLLGIGIMMLLLFNR